MPLQRQRSGVQYRCSVSEAVLMRSAKGRSFADVSYVLLFQLVARKTQNVSGDNKEIYLSGAFKDISDLTITHPFFSQPFARIAQRPQEFHAFLRYQSRCTPGLAFGHGCLEAVALTGIKHGCGTPGAASRFASMSKTAA